MNTLENAEIAIQKNGGRNVIDSIQWINQNAGADFPVTKEPFDKTRELTDSASGITLVGYSNGDILKAVSCGFADFGIVGEDKLRELVLPETYSRVTGGVNRFGNITSIAKVRSNVGRMVVARNPEIQGVEPGERKIATSYPNTAKAWVDRSNFPFGRPQVDYFSGGIEMIARRQGYDTVIDVVHSGDTLTANGFVEVECLGAFSLDIVKSFRSPLSPEIFDVLRYPSMLEVLSRRLKERKRNPTDSLASLLVTDEQQAVRKVQEEAGELNVEVLLDGEIEPETADLLMAICAANVNRRRDIRLAEVELASRYEQKRLQFPPKLLNRRLS